MIRLLWQKIKFSFLLILPYFFIRRTLVFLFKKNEQRVKLKILKLSNVKEINSDSGKNKKSQK